MSQDITMLPLEYKTIDKTLHQENIDTKKIVYKGLRNIETNIDRYYFNKYIKYKLKYLNLLHNLGN